MKKGIVYVLKNQAMPRRVKIGKTTNLEKRIKGLDSTGVPLPFECAYAVEVDNYEKIETLIHNAFSNARSRSKREFFEIDEQQAIAALMIAEELGGTNVTPGKSIVEDKEDIQALKEASDRRPPFKFSMVKLKKGAVIHYIRDKSITATVHTDKTIWFRGKEYSLTGATKKLLRKTKIRGGVTGPQYWDYDGETLSARRRRIEAE